MKKRTTPLRLRRETLTDLDAAKLKLGGAASVNGSTCPIASCYEECIPSGALTCFCG